MPREELGRLLAPIRRPVKATLVDLQRTSPGVAKPEDCARIIHRHPSIGGCETRSVSRAPTGLVLRGAPRGRELTCRGWEQEGALRCLLNNLDPDVAEDAGRLVVYGGRGRAARGQEALAEIVAALERLGPEETLIVQSGKAVAVVPTHADAPRVLISTAMVVPAWSDEASFHRLEDAGLTMYGQMTAAGWFYIGTQGILGFTYETFRAVAAAHFGGSLAGRRVLTAGLGGMGGAQGFGVAEDGGARSAARLRAARLRRRRSGRGRSGRRRLPKPRLRLAGRARRGATRLSGT